MRRRLLAVLYLACRSGYTARYKGQRKRRYHRLRKIEDQVDRCGVPYIPGEIIDQVIQQGNYHVGNGQKQVSAEIVEVDRAKRKRRHNAHNHPKDAAVFEFIEQHMAENHFFGDGGQHGRKRREQEQAVGQAAGEHFERLRGLRDMKQPAHAGQHKAHEERDTQADQQFEPQAFFEIPPVGRQQFMKQNDDQDERYQFSNKRYKRRDIGVIDVDKRYE